MNIQTAGRNCNTVIVIVDYFKAPRVVQNIESLLMQKNCPNTEICIIDNSCDPENKKELLQLDKYKNVHLQFNKKNLGYTRACNDAARLFDARYVVLVNPDISWKNKSTLSELISQMDAEPNIGILGPRQINDDGTTPNTVRTFPNIIAQVARRTPLRLLPILDKYVKRYEIENFDYSRSQYVDWIQSSFLVIRGDLWKELGGLDTSYFIFMSDPEICFRAWSMGYKVFYTADPIVGADGKRCSEGGLSQIFKSKAMQYHIRDALIYQIKHLFHKQPDTKQSSSG